MVNKKRRSGKTFKEKIYDFLVELNEETYLETIWKEIEDADIDDWDGFFRWLNSNYDDLYNKAEKAIKENDTVRAKRI